MSENRAPAWGMPRTLGEDLTVHVCEGDVYPDDLNTSSERTGETYDLRDAAHAGNTHAGATCATDASECLPAAHEPFADEV
ncbi:hypothetical protein, partial [Bifidobacterium longum]|uniref:hypothetical protein n=1 Tax=Bifidobacterium longum TaxID=216816 RepID=UPI001C4DFCC7